MEHLHSRFVGGASMRPYRVNRVETTIASRRPGQVQQPAHRLRAAFRCRHEAQSPLDKGGVVGAEFGEHWASQADEDKGC